MIMIIGLILAAFVMIFFEVLLPGGVLGVLAAVCILVAAVLGVQNYGIMTGGIIFLASVLGGFALVLFEFKFLSKTKYGQKLLLNATVDGHSNSETSDETVIGQTGETITRLNPTGMISINGKKYEAFSQDGYVDRGQAVKVLNRDNFRLIIQKT